MGSEEIKLTEAIGYKQSINLTCKGITNAEFYVIKPPKKNSDKKEGENSEATEASKEEKVDNLENKFVLEGNTLTIKDIRRRLVLLLID